MSQFRPPFRPQDQPPQYPQQPYMPPQSMPSYQQMQPAPQPPKKKSRKRLWLIIGAVILLAIIIGATQIGKGNTTTTTPQATQAPTQQSQPTQAPTQAPTAQPTVAPTVAPTQALAPIPSASELSQLFSSQDGKVTDVNVPATNSDGTKNVAVDVLVNSPTQARVKHLCFELAQFFFQRSDVSLVNIAFHANGYTGLDDPIAGCGGIAPTGWTGMSEDQLWTALTGVFDANLPA